jgi:hypothetical protein
MQSYFSLLPLDHIASKFELFWFSGFLKRFSNMSYFGSVVFMEKIFNDLAQFLQFYDYLPFEEEPGPFLE